MPFNYSYKSFSTHSDLYPVLNSLPDYEASRWPTKFAIFNLDPRAISAQKSFFELHNLSKIIDDIINNNDFSVFHVDSLNATGIDSHGQIFSIIARDFFFDFVRIFPLDYARGLKDQVRTISAPNWYQIDKTYIILKINRLILYLSHLRYEC